MSSPQPESSSRTAESGQTKPTARGAGDALLVTNQLYKEYSQRTVVNGVSIHVGAGEIVGLLGPNGAGKTTTFNMVVGVVKPDDGDVKFLKQDITRLPMHERARLGIGYLTQEPSVFRKLTVEQNILAILETCRMGRDEASVVDERLRVRGLQGLRVVDCSVIPVPISGNTNAVAMATGYRGSDLILEDWKLRNSA